MNVKKTITTTLATGALLLGALSPAFAADVLVSGNGAGSSNAVSVSSNHTMDVSQTNNTSTSNFVLANATTGGNNASANTGGNTSVTSGAANTTVGIANQGSSNTLSLNTCGCDNMGASVYVTGNGAGSHNYVNERDTHRMNESQTNNTYTTNAVYANAATGGNNASANTGGSQWMLRNGWVWINGMWRFIGSNTGGSTNVSSGPAYTTVGIYNGGNSNKMY